MLFVLRTAVVAGGVLIACSTSKYPTPSAQCSDGPTWPRGTSFEYERSGPTDAPACTPHCAPIEGASAMWGGQGALTSDALPSGACDEDGVVCTMRAEWLGPCPLEGQASGPLNLFICRCTSGAWTCTVDATAPSATVWSCRMPDGSDFNHRDAGADAGSTLQDGGK